jgi:hypothetical protein
VQAKALRAAASNDILSNEHTIELHAVNLIQDQSATARRWGKIPQYCQFSQGYFGIKPARLGVVSVSSGTGAKA